MRYPDFIEKPYRFPSFFHVRVQRPKDQINDIPAAMEAQMRAVIPHSGIKAGDRVALAVGSRGIYRLSDMVKSMCDQLKAIGARPFIIPAMGSHGGATAEGQQKVLETLGVTPAAIGAPVISSMETVQIGTVMNDVPVYFSKEAAEMDHTLCINRIKPHTKFKAPMESGLVKMLCVGLGKHQGAITWHHYALKYGFYELLCAMGEAIVINSNVRFGIGVVENAYDQPLIIEAVPALNMWGREKALLAIAKNHFPRLPIREVDALIVEHIGKDISGAGMDPNVTGRSLDLKESDFSQDFNAMRIAILNLTVNTDGNAIGLGHADFITEKVFAHLDYEKTVLNALTSNSIRKAFIPVRLPTDEKAIQACFSTLGPIPPEAVRAVIIQNTRQVFDFWASSALRPELESLSTIRLSKDFFLRWDTDGNLILPPLA